MRALTATRSPSRRLRSASSVSTLALAAMLVSAPGGQLLAQVAPNSAATQVRNADNGVPVVQIANPNAAGISVNTYDAFNVSSRGVVLNNATAADANAEGRVTTQLAGLVDINRNLTAPARAILNEVTSTNPTVLAGYLEVAGQRADVIVANPNGISCGGCGVINTAAFTLTTGRSRIDGTGQLLGFDVTGGTIALTGAGLDAQTTDYAALLGRKIALGGPAYGKVLDVVGGAHRWDYQARTASALAGVGAAPDYAIDSTAVGGIYANRIRLIATEAGVGVRLLGDAAAVADDLTITAAGDLELRASISAARDLAIAAGSAGAGDLTASDTSLTSGRDLALAAAGKTTLTGGAIIASGNLSLTSAALADTASATALANANQRYAGGAMSFDIAGAATLGGTSYGAAGSLTGLVGSLATTGSGFVYSNGGALTLTAGTGNLDLGGYAVTSPGALTLDAAGFVSSAGNGTVVSDNGAVTVRAGAGLNNAGTIAANAGGIALQLGGTSANSGTIVAQGDLTLADRSGGGGEAFTNAASGRLLTSGSLTMKAAVLRNDGTVQAARTIATADNLANTGLFIAATDPAADAAITVGSLTNVGTLQASRDLALHLATSFANNGTTSAARGLTIDGGAVATNAAGAAISGATVNAVLASLDNAGTVVGGSALTLATTGTLTNRATVGSNGTLVVTAGSLSNAATGTLQSGMGGSVSATGALVNAGAVYLANASGSGTISAGTLDNQAGGQIVSQADLALRIGGATLANAGNLLAQGNLAITGTGTALAVTNAGQAFIQAGSAAGKSVTIGGTAVNLTTAANSVLTGNGIALTLASLDNAGALNANGALAFTATGAASNSGVLIAGATVTGTAASVANSASGGIQAGTGVTLSASGTLENAGTILTTKGNGGAITLGGALDNAAGAIVQADGLLSLTLATAGSRNAGTLLGVGGVALHGGTNAVILTNAATGVVAAQAATGAAPVTLTSDGALSLVNIAGGVLTADRLTLGLASLDNAGAIGATAGSNTINVAGTLANSGNLVLSADTGGSGTVTAASLTNSGSLASNGELTVNLRTMLANSGALQAVGNLSLIAGSNAAAFTNSAAGRIVSGSALSISGANAAFSDQSGQVTGQTVAVTLASLANTGTVVANGNLGLTVSGALANSGTIGANATLTLAAGNLDNASAGQIQSEIGGAITIAGLLDDAGRIFLANSSGNAALTLGSLKVQQGARLVSLGKLALTFAGGAPTLDNAGLISAQDDITLSGTGIALTNRLTGTIQTAPASPTATGRITLDGSGTVLINQGLVLGNGLDWSFASLDNPGTIQSRGNLALAYSGAGQNAGTIYAQGGTAAITAAGFTNLAGSVFQADKGATFTLAGDLNNAGTLIGSTDGAGTLLVNAANLANSSAIQSGKDATFNLSGSGFVNSGTVIAAGDLAIHGTGATLSVSATGSGVIAAQAAAGATPARLTIDGPATVLATDAGAAIAADAASLTLGSFVNAGRFVTGSGATTLTIAGTLTNTGKVFTGGTLGLTAASLDNRLGAVFAPDNGTITLGTDLTNAGTVYVAGNLALRAINGDNRAIAFDNRFTAGPGGSTGTDGLFQVVGMLDAKAGGLAFGIGAGSTLLAGRLDLGIASISNAGTIQGDVGSSIGLSGALLNQGAIYFVPAASGIFPAVTISADTITNGGTGDIEAATGLALNGTNGISNAAGGKIVANDALTLATPGSGAQVINAGLLSADTILANQVRQFVFQTGGRSTSRLFTMRPNDSGLSGTLLQLADGAQISASDSFLIGVDSLAMQGAGSRLVGGSGVSGLTTFGPLTVNGLIYGGGGLNLEVRSDQPLVVSSTGAIASGGATTIVARPAFVSQVGQVINSGEIYGATAVNITAGGAIINKGTSDVASASAGFAGSIDSGGSITLTTSIPTYGFVGTIANYSQINASGDITINTTNFTNSTPGDWTRTTSSQTTSDASVLVSVGARSCTNATPSVCNDEQIFRRQMHRFDVQSFANGLSGPSYAPQVVSGGSLSVNGFSRVENVGGTLSAGTINLNGANASSTFLSDSLALQTKETRFYFLDVVRHTITFANPNSTTVLSDVTTSATKTCFSVADDPACGQNFGDINTLFSYRAAATNPGIFAGTLNGNNFGLTNIGSARTVNANTMTATATAPGASSGTATGTAAPTAGGVGTTGATGA
ncbi:filamentous hemagglutinin N-terminal domain-containing protein, partial [Novosphingobium sp. LASN5T]|uniref:two-partner secretion domain-containing protein n=1 Tax=Novosphingobium sp. LASN5T TaxID=2491021 RepID=UPI0016814E22